MSLTAIVGATVIDGTGAAPQPNAVVLVEGERIVQVSPAGDTVIPEQAQTVEAPGRHVIPGLMDANVHLCSATTPDLVLEFEGRYDELVVEAAQLALRAGVTTVFETWGPLEPLRAVRDRIDRGEVTGSRMFIGGNIIGFDGPISSDFFGAGDALGDDTRERVNRHWEQGVGSDLLWLSKEQIRDRVREYIERSGIDLVKYGASGHKAMHFIAFSQDAQRAIVEEGHRAGLTVQAHTTSPESLRMEIDAGADLLQHGDVTGKQPMPEATLRRIVEQQLPVAALLCTDDYMDWLRANGSEMLKLVHLTRDENDRRLIEAGGRLLLTTDGFANGPRKLNHPYVAAQRKGMVDDPIQLGESHLRWLRAAVERGMAPMEVLLSATRYIAEAYRKDAELGTLEPGKRADLLVLDGDPLADVASYGRIEHVMKDGVVVDREALPARRVLTAA